MVSIMSSIPMLWMIFSLSEVILHNLPADFETREEICQRYLKVQVQSPWQRVLETSREVIPFLQKILI